MADWYEGGFPDRELVVMDCLKPALDLVDVLDDTGQQVYDGVNPRRPYVCTFLPKSYDDYLPIVRVFRGGGTADVDTMVDPATVQVAVIASSRAEAWELLEYCRQWLLTYRHGGTVVRTDGSTTLIDSLGELAGPQQVLDLNRDNRMVPFQFRVVCRRPRGRDYQKERERIVTALLTP